MIIIYVEVPFARGGRGASSRGRACRLDLMAAAEKDVRKSAAKQ